MTGQDTIARIRLANPVPDADALHADPEEAAALFSSILRRRDIMLGTKLQRFEPLPSQKRPWYRRPGLAFAATAVAALAVIAPLAIFGGDEPDAADEPRVTTTATSLAPPTTSLAPTTTGSPAETTVAPTTTVPPTTEAPPPPRAGYDWSLVPGAEDLVPEVGEVSGLTRVSSGFVASGWGPDDCSRIWFSVDGSVWEPANLPETSGACGQLINGLTATGDLAMAYGGGLDQAYVWISENGGRAWREIPAGTLPFPGTSVRTAAAGDDGFVVENDAGVWLSPDGDVWYAATRPPGHNFVDVAYGPHGYVAVARGPGYVRVGDQEYVESTVLISPDGTDWTLVGAMTGAAIDGTPCGVQLNTVAAGPNGYVAAGVCSGWRAPGVEPARIRQWAVFYSVDGLEWTQGSFADATPDEEGAIVAAAAGDGGFLLAGYQQTPGEDHATLWFSADGQTWTRTELVGDRSSYAKAVAIADGAAVAVGRIDATPVFWRGTPR